MKLEEVLKKVQPDIVLVHGDTTTSFRTSAAEFSESLMKNYKPVLNRYRKVVF